MQAAVIHLITSNSFQKEAQTDHSKLIIDTFVQSCMALDASLFEPYMDEENIFETKNKYLFLASMNGKSTQIDPLPPRETDPLPPFQIDPLIPAQIDPLK